MAGASAIAKLQWFGDALSDSPGLRSKTLKVVQYSAKLYVWANANGLVREKDPKTAVAPNLKSLAKILGTSRKVMNLGDCISDFFAMREAVRSAWAEPGNPDRVREAVAAVTDFICDLTTDLQLLASMSDSPDVSRSGAPARLLSDLAWAGPACESKSPHQAAAALVLKPCQRPRRQCPPPALPVRAPPRPATPAYPSPRRAAPPCSSPAVRAQSLPAWVERANDITWGLGATLAVISASGKLSDCVEARSKLEAAAAASEAAGAAAARRRRRSLEEDRSAVSPLHRRAVSALADDDHAPAHGARRRRPASGKGLEAARSAELWARVALARALCELVQSGPGVFGLDTPSELLYLVCGLANGALGVWAACAQ